MKEKEYLNLCVCVWMIKNTKKQNKQKRRKGAFLAASQLSVSAKLAKLKAKNRLAASLGFVSQKSIYTHTHYLLSIIKESIESLRGSLLLQ